MRFGFTTRTQFSGRLIRKPRHGFDAYKAEHDKALHERGLEKKALWAQGELTKHRSPEMQSNGSFKAHVTMRAKKVKISLAPVWRKE